MQPTFAQWLEENLREKHASLSDVARQARIAQPYLSLLRQGKRKNPSPAVVKSIARALDADVADAFRAAGLSGQPQPIEAWNLRVSINHLPVRGPHLVGRHDELERLNQAWQDMHTHVVVITGLGGIGKLALVNHWLAQMAKENYRGAERVFGWSFQTQKTGDKQPVSTELFIATALRWFGDQAPPTSSGRDTGERLARLVRRSRTLLMLDGLEALQEPPGLAEDGLEEGRLKDPTIRVLLRELAAENSGLCVITTRHMVADLGPWIDSTMQVLPLAPLLEKAGAELLRKLGVQGTPDELKEAAAKFQGHPLALCLLGHYLRKAYGGDVRSLFDVVLAKVDERYSPAYNMMRIYEHELQGQPEQLRILYLLSLFYRPPDSEALKALLSKEISSLTDTLPAMNEPAWQIAVSNLREIGLLNPAHPEHPEVFETHPLVRQYFDEQCQQKTPEAWHEAHKCLYEYYQQLYNKNRPPQDTEETTVLLSAIYHGCKADEHKEVFQELLLKKCYGVDSVDDLDKADVRFPVTDGLGQYADVHQVLHCFFKQPWTTPNEEFDEKEKAFLFRTAGICLRALGHFEDSKNALSAWLEISEGQQNWRLACRASRNLSQTSVALGEIKEAIEYGKRSIEFADEAVHQTNTTDDLVEKKYSLARYAEALHHDGRLDEAERNFGEAEQIQKKLEHERPILYHFEGFEYCELLLTRIKNLDASVPKHEYLENVVDRARKSLEWAQPSQEKRDPFSLAVAHLASGRSMLEQCRQESNHAVKGQFEDTKSFLDKAWELLQEAGQRQHFPLGPLALAELYIEMKDFAKAKDYLSRANDSAEGRLKLHQVDCYLGQVRLYLTWYSKDQNPEFLQKARENHMKASRLVDKTGYHRRDREVKELAEQLEQYKESDGAFHSTVEQPN